MTAETGQIRPSTALWRDGQSGRTEVRRSDKLFGKAPIILDNIPN